MRVLVAISILAFVALLWASIAIFRHIRRAHRRRRRFLESSQNSLNPAPPDRFVIVPPAAKPAVPEIVFTDPEAPIPEPPAPPPPAYQALLRQAEVPTPAAHSTIPYAAPAPQPEIPAATDSSAEPLPAWPHFGFTPARPIASTEPIPYAAPPPTESSASVAVARTPIEIQPPAPAVKPLYPSANPLQPEAAPPPRPLPLRAGQLPLRRVDWSYYNEDMGDLSDPAPAGSRTKIRTTTSE